MPISPVSPTHVAVALDRVVPGVAPELFALLAVPDRLGPPELGESFGEALYDLERDVASRPRRFSRGRLRGGRRHSSAALLDAAPRRLHTILCTRKSPASRCPVSGPWVTWKS